jgi:succinyl-diaminopimelate desuccinylase
MKAGLAVMLHLLEDPEVVMGTYDLVGIFYAGEEGPSAGNELETILNSAAWLQEAELAVVLEPSDGEIQIGCNGIINARVVFRGRSAHSARPWLGDNAISKAGSFLEGLHRRQPEAVEISGLVYREVISATRAQGGIANNIIPPLFELNLNYRFAPTKTLVEAEATLREICAAADEVEVVDGAPAGPVDTDHVLLDKLAAAADATRTAKQGWTDVARFGTRGIQAVNFGPGETAQAHQADESVALADLDRSFESLRSTLVG